jgi:nitrile hydratase
MAKNALEAAAPTVVTALGEEPRFKPGQGVRIAMRSPLGHYRVPIYVRGRRGSVETVIDPRAVDNEEEGFGRNAGTKGYYYRVVIPLAELWPGYHGAPKDDLRIEIFESWLEGV